MEGIEQSIKENFCHHSAVDPPEKKEEFKQTREEVARFSAHTLGISGMHPNPRPAEWPGPYGQDVMRPATNCLRNRFLDLDSKEGCQCQYEKLINRCMLHHCREGYCLNCARRDKVTREMICRFHFPIDLHGFKMIFDEAGAHIAGLQKIPTESDVGAEFCRNELKFLRNHPVVVHHVPELLLIWGANIEGRPVQSYKQVLRYLLKYMFKDEPNSSPFQATAKAVIEASVEEEPVRRSFQKILMKTVGEHDLSKQECHHILNGLDFVDFSADFVSVNVSGTARVRTPLLDGDDQKATEDNLATIYGNRETDPNYLAALEKYRSEEYDPRHPHDPDRVSLYEFAMWYNKKWQRQQTSKVPHVTPNFNVIPKRSTNHKSRYAMFVLTTFLLHLPGMSIDELKIESDDHLEHFEKKMKEFITFDSCPKLVAEEFLESQEGEEEKREGQFCHMHKRPLHTPCRYRTQN